MLCCIVSIRPCVNKRQIDVPISAIRIKDIKETVLTYSCVRCFLQANPWHIIQNKALNIGDNIEYFMRIKLIRKQGVKLFIDIDVRNSRCYHPDKSRAKT